MGRVLGIQELAEEVERLRREGRRIAFANGHFDLLHVGHLRYLAAARAAADVLIVAINDDASVARLKGPGRPIVPAAERAELVAALEPVDYVTVFSGDTPVPLLARLQPHVHCKGTDYGSPERVPEYEVVRAYGGETRLVGDAKDHATSDLIARVRATISEPDPGVRQGAEQTHPVLMEVGSMPEISRFLGISIRMFFNDHDPAHFHVQYNEFRAKVEIESLRTTQGRLPPRVLGLVLEWGDLHRAELLANWQSLRTSGTCRKVEPLV